MIKFGGEYTLLEPRGGKLSYLMDRFLSVDELRMFGCLPGHRNVQRGHNLHYPNYADPMPTRFNELRVPTGATRWSSMLLLLQRDQLRNVADELGASNVASTLEYSSNLPDQLTKWTMHTLPARPITPRGAIDLPENTSNTDPGLWVLPLVCPRFYWQWKTVGKISDEEFTSVDDLVQFLAGKLGVTITHSIDSSYQAPDVAHVANDYLSPAVLLDSLAHETMTRLVPAGVIAGDEWELVSYAESTERLEGNLNGDNQGAAEQGSWGEMILGDIVQNSDPRSSGRKPEKLMAAFPKTAGGYRVIEETVSGDTTPSTTRVLWSTVEDDGANSDELADHAAQMFVDYQGTADVAYDMTLAGSMQWMFTVWDDEIVFSQARLALPTVKELGWPEKPSEADGFEQHVGVYRNHMRMRSFPYDHDWHPVRDKGEGGIQDGLVECFLGNGLYRIELATLGVDLDSDECPSSVGLLPGEDPCEEWNTCPDPLASCPTFPRLTPTGIGEYIIAYDPHPLPLEAGAHVVLGLAGSGELASTASASSGSGSAGWRVLRAYEEPICLDRVTSWKCEVDCDGNFTGNIVADKVKRTIVTGIDCGECTVNELSCSSSS